MKKILILLIYLVVLSAYGQEDSEVDTMTKLRWMNSFQVGQMFSNNEEITGRLSASYLSGVQRGRLAAGIEVGYNDYELFKLGSLALLGKFNIKKSAISPYTYGLIGYGLPLYFEDDSRIDATSSEGGMLTGGGVGIDFPMGKMSLTIQVGYKFQKTTYNEPAIFYYRYSVDALSDFAPNYVDYDYTTRKMNRVEFKLGILF